MTDGSVRYHSKNNFSNNNNNNNNHNHNVSSNEISYEFFNIFKERSSTILIAHWICFGLGSVAVFINLYLMVSIMINRKTLIKNVFYALVLHCAFVDLIRSAALIGWCLPGLRLVDFAPFATVKQLLLIVLRSLNLLTALNLLVFTVNEYVLVSRPLHYKRVIRRRLIAILIGLSWILSLTFVLGGVFAQSFTPGIQQVYILSKKEGNKTKNNNHHHRNETYGSKIVRYDDEEDEDNLELEESSSFKEGDFSDGEFFSNLHLSPNINESFSSNDSGISNFNQTSSFISSKSFFLARNQFNHDPAHYTSIFAVMIVCFVCLFIVVTCYSMILYRIRKFHISNRSRRVFQQNLHRNQSSRTSQKRPILRRPDQQQNVIVVDQNGPIRSSVKGDFVSNNTLSPKNLESPEKSKLKNSPSNRSVTSRLSTLNIYRHEETIFSAETAPEKSPPSNFVCCFNKSGRFSKISRLKYVVVVGFVLIVDLLFLLSYSIIQIFQYLHISQKNANYYDPNDMLFLRYVLQILIGVHSVLQPLCYFRVKSFCRPLFCFDRLNRKFGGGRKEKRPTKNNHHQNISISNSNYYYQNRQIATRKILSPSKKFSDANFKRQIKIDRIENEQQNRRFTSPTIDEL